MKSKQSQIFVIYNNAAILSDKGELECFLDNKFDFQRFKLSIFSAQDFQKAVKSSARSCHPFQIGFLKGEATTLLINHWYQFLLIFRAKQRKDVRYEETRGDWYFDRKLLRETHEEKTQCSSKDKDCHEKSKGERFMRRDKGKSDKMKSKGEGYT